MGDQKQFEQLLIPIRRQLLVQLILKEVQILFLLAGASVFLVVAVASFVIMPFLIYYFLAMFALVIILFFIRVWKNRPGLNEAAAIYNLFVSEDRVLTAFSFFGKEGDLEKLQLADAVSCMKKVQHQVSKRKKYVWVPKWVALALMFGLAAALVYVTAPDQFEVAKRLEKDIKLVEEMEKELAEKVEKEKDPEVKKTLKEAAKKLRETKTAEAALKELEKQSKKLELQSLKEKEKQKVLEAWQNGLNQNGMSHLANLLEQKNLEAIEKELKELNQNWNQLSEAQQMALSQLSQQDHQLTDEQLQQLIKQIELALQSPKMSEQLAAAQAAIQQTGMTMQNQMAANGLPPSQIAFAPPGQSRGQQGSTPNGNGQQPNPSGQKNNGNSNGQGNGSGAGTGSGTGTGQGAGSGSGSGAGSGSGSGSGAGSGFGTGAGLGQGSRELLTIPNRLQGNPTIQTDNGQIGEGAPGQQSEGPGPILRGNIRPYTDVFGAYERAYRQSTERLELPADLGDIVKNYFSTIDPNKE